MLRINAVHSAKSRAAEAGGAGIGPALLGGWLGGTALAVAALVSGLGWLAALALYSLGGAFLVATLAALPLIGNLHLRPPTLRPVAVRLARVRTH